MEDKKMKDIRTKIILAVFVIFLGCFIYQYNYFLIVPGVLILLIQILKIFGIVKPTKK
jgi:hypothetical protein